MNNEQPGAGLGQEVVVILCSPSYTPLTTHTGRWLEDVTIPSGFLEHRLTGQNIAFRDIVTKQVGGDRTLITIFCGHGLDNALLGPPRDGQIIRDSKGTPHSIIYSTEPFEPNPKVLFAFCCSSAKKLGNRFALTADSSFLGFNGPLEFVTDEQFMGTLQSIVKQTAERIIADQNITPEHEKLLRGLYQKAYNYYLNGEGKKNKYWWLMTLHLLTHKKLISRYSGGTSNYPPAVGN